MKTKLTLSVDKELVQFAQTLAQTNKKSISGMFSEYLQHRQSQLRKSSTPTINAMRGSLKSFPIDDSKQAIRAAYAQKYSR